LVSNTDPGIDKFVPIDSVNIFSFSEKQKETFQAWQFWLT